VRPAHRPAREIELALGERSGERLETKLAAGELGTMTLRMLIEPGDPAAVHRFDVSQHGRDGLVGAARVMTLAVDEELLERPYEEEAS
jgi:hypothetical protein